MIFTGCATTNSVSASTKSQNQKQNTNHTNKNDKDSEKLRFLDWKYKGFGQSLPQWVEFAVDENITSLKNEIPAFTEKTQIKIIKGFGINYDHADHKALQILEENNPKNSDYELFEHFWVKQNTDPQAQSQAQIQHVAHPQSQAQVQAPEMDLSMPYISIYLYYKVSP